MTNEDLYTTLSDSKLIAGVMGRLGIEGDAVWYDIDGRCWNLDKTTQGISTLPGEFNSFRLDKILSALPDWCFNFPQGIDEDDVYVQCCKHITSDSVMDISSLLFDLHSYLRGKEVISAGCALLALLEEEKLI